MAKLFKRDTAFLLLIVLVFSIYSAVFIYKTSFVIDGERYFSLFDDAMVSMRYAENFAEGHGLVMNQGEKVEGYTNPLWVLYMAVVHFLPLSRAKISIVIQLTGALFLLINLFYVRKTALLISEGSSLASAGAVFLTAFYLPLINWSLQGMEVSLQTLIISIALFKALISIRSNSFSPFIYILLGINTLVRIDMAVPYVGIWLFTVFSVKKHRRRNLIWGAVILFIFIGGQTLARLLYYGELLPNTYYLKMTGYPVILRIVRGFLVMGDFIGGLNILLFLVPVFLLIFSYNHSLGMLAIITGLQILYSIYVGGDAWEDTGGSNRYCAVIMPEFFILFAYGLSQLCGMISDISKKFISADTGIKAMILKYSFHFFVIISFFQFNNNTEPLDYKGLFLISRPLHVENNRGMIERALMIKRLTTPEAKIGVTWAGAIPYFSERYTVDFLGKTDKKIARDKMRTVEGSEKYRFFLPGHLKYNYSYSIGELKPDVVLQFWGDLEEVNPYIADKYTKLIVADKFYYLRGESENILWNKFMNRKN